MLHMHRAIRNISELAQAKSGLEDNVIYDVTVGIAKYAFQTFKLNTIMFIF